MLLPINWWGIEVTETRREVCPSLLPSFQKPFNKGWAIDRKKYFFTKILILLGIFIIRYHLYPISKWHTYKQIIGVFTWMFIHHPFLYLHLRKQVDIKIVISPSISWLKRKVLLRVQARNQISPPHLSPYIREEHPNTQAIFINSRTWLCLSNNFYKQCTLNKIKLLVTSANITHLFKRR